MKDYKIWTQLKSRINNSNSFPLWFKEKEIWYASLGENIGFEEDGKGARFTRPVLVLKKFSKKLCFIVPLTSRLKRGDFYFSFDGNTGKISTAILNQLRTIDSNRLLYKIGKINQEDFSVIQRKIQKFIFNSFEPC